MEKHEQISFVKDLLDNIFLNFFREAQKGNIPENWDGFELHQFVADKAKELAHVDMGKKRRRDYNNEVLIRDL